MRVRARALKRTPTLGNLCRAKKRTLPSQKSSLLDWWERDGALARPPAWLEGDIVHEHKCSDAVRTAPGSQLTSAVIQQQQWPVSKVTRPFGLVGWELPNVWLVLETPLW